MSPELVPPDAVVVRFPPVTHERVERRATLAFVASGSYGLSVFADCARPDEGEDGLFRRLIGAAELEGLDVAGNRRYCVCTAADLFKHGFTFEKDGYTGEAAVHYSVNVGSGNSQLRPISVCKFLAEFADRRLPS